MTKRFWIIVSLLLMGSLMTSAVQAQDEAVSTATFVGSYTLWAAIIIGIAASIATLIYAYRLRGGVVNTALNLFGGGMLLVVLGFLAVVVSWTDADTQKIVHDLAFILGYVLMLAGALQLRKIA